MMIKAIETSYKGYRFRSRLEARWAVFFDALGIKWEYEKEGFDLGDGLRYLPDFWLPDHLWFVEVKAIPPVDDELAKIRALNDNPPEPALGVICVVGIPEVPVLREYAVEDKNTGKNCGIIVNPTGNTVSLLLRCDLLFLKPNWSMIHIEKAVQMARSARFEHGEYPQ